MSEKNKIIIGEISSIRFRNSEGWAVFSLAGQYIGFTGTLADMVDVGTEVTCTGKIESGRYGEQLKCETVVPAAPDISTDKGVIKLLQRLLGIGPKKAMMAVQEHGHEAAWNFALNDPEKIGVKKIHAESAKSLTATLLDSYESTVYLLSIGLTDHQAALIYKIYGKHSRGVVSVDPYKLTEIDGFGFITVDKIALKAGISIANPSRITACILFVLDDSASNGGNVWHNGWKLADIVLELLTTTAMKAEVPLSGAPDINLVQQQAHYLNAEDKVSISNGRIFSQELLNAETTILDFIGGAASDA